MCDRIIKNSLIKVGIFAAFLSFYGPFCGVTPAQAGQNDAWRKPDRKPVTPVSASVSVSAPQIQDAARIVKMAANERYAEALAAAAKLSDPTVRSLAEWYAYGAESTKPDFNVVANFIERHHNWPGMVAVRKKAEDMFPKGQAPVSVERWFDANPPVTKGGAVLYIDALKAQDKTSKAVQALNAWFVSAVLNPQDQLDVLNRYGGMISRDLMLSRFEYTLLNGYETNARQIATRLGGGYPALADARIALSNKGKNVDGLIARIPANMQNDAGLLYERIRWRRQSGNEEGAVALLREVGTVTQPDLLEALWKERNIAARELLEQKRYKEAYAIASKHGLKTGFAHAQAQWTAGWIALRFINQPMKAFEHFDALYKNVETSLSKSRGAYWAARASEAVGDMNTASLWYQAAARYPTVFYGQLALDRLGRRANYDGLPETAPSGAAFAGNPKARAVILLMAADQSGTAGRFLDSLSDDADAGLVRYSDVAALAQKVGLPHYAVKIAKKAENKGHILTQQAFPQLPSSVPFGDRALIHALIRQESAFHTGAVSSAGARGLMQLMPATAQETAKKNGMSHNKDWLTQRPDHNIALGSRYIEQVLNRFDGSYPLAIAAYNAGPGRVSGWIKTYGDPRGLPSYEMLDWIESIPVYETRNYVQRVMEGMYVYADLLGQRPAWDHLRTAYNR